MGMHSWRRRIEALAFGVLCLCGVLLAPAGVHQVSALPDLDILASKTAAQAADYLTDHPEIAASRLNADPGDVASWWRRTSATDRQTLVQRVPATIGNLDGVDYATRDAANRAHLAAEIADADAELTADPSDTAVADERAALKAISGALTAKGAVPRFLIALTDQSPPLAAIAVGDVDTASMVTVTVPGMGTYTNDMQLWTNTAENVWNAQGRAGAPTDRAVVAWIGYRAPPPGIDATMGEYAGRGAPKLVADLTGISVVRGDALTTLNVIAHSYGTTMAADALADHDLGVFAFVMLGSAGIEEWIPDAGALSARHVYAAEATADTEAQWGRLSRQDPRSPGFGATVFGVDGDAALGLAAVTGHDPVLHSQWNDNPGSAAWTSIADTRLRDQQYAEHMKRFGYLDDGTESLENAATATTPNANRSLT